MHLPENHCSTLLTTGYKRPDEEELETFAFCLWLFWALVFALGHEAFCLWLLSFAFGFWCGKLLEGKRITEGKLLKGKEWLKRG
jgi:hypothetical protein